MNELKTHCYICITVPIFARAIAHNYSTLLDHFRVTTIDGTTEAGKDYTPVNQMLVFLPQEATQNVTIDILDDKQWEFDDVFYVKLSLLDDATENRNVRLGKACAHEIRIINDDEPGTVEFTKSSFLVRENCGTAGLVLTRSNGADGVVTVHWRTEEITAVDGRDYTGGEGEVVFEHGETQKVLGIPINNDWAFEKDECFKVKLVKVSAGARLGYCRNTVVQILNDDEFTGTVNRLISKTIFNVDALCAESATWQRQIRNALNVNGGDVKNATNWDYILHFLSCSWKVLFALVPPPTVFGGWPAFCISLFLVSVLVLAMKDLATIFGCLVGLKDSVTAITFVVLGTNLPDLIANQQAAVHEKTADNSIGNVPGSINILLGLGLPWLMAAIYWTSKGETFEVPAGFLSFSVVVYALSAFACLCLLGIRRNFGLFGNSELGGPTIPKYITAVFFFALWLLFVLLSAFKAYGYLSIDF